MVSNHHFDQVAGGTAREQVGSLLLCLGSAKLTPLKGNTAFGKGRWEEAHKCYTASIHAYPLDHRTWSNRAMANLKLQR